MPPETDGANALQGESTESAPSTQGQGSPQEQQSGGNSLYAEFLKGIPETQRPLLEPHIKNWDAQVTKKFQELHSQYEPYKPFLENQVDPRVLQNAFQVYQMLEQNPQQVYQLLHQQFGTSEEEQGLLGEGEEEEDPDYPGLPAPVVQRLKQQEAILTRMAQMLIQKEQMSTQQQEDAALDAYMESLKEQFGDFDEDWVLTKIANGVPGEKAVEQFNQMIQQRINGGAGKKPNLPPSLSGGGAPPAEGFSPKDIPTNDLKDMVANILAQAKQG